MSTTKPADDMIRFTEYVPVGGGISWPFTTMPTSNVCEWAVFAGQTLSRTTYATLWALASGVTGFGVGDGSTTFTVPDYRGRFQLGVSSSYAIGSTGGAATHTLDANEMPAHSHAVGIGGTGGDDVGIPGNAAGTEYSSTSTSVGGSAAHNNMPPYAAINFIFRIK